MKKRKRKLRVVSNNPSIDDDDDAPWSKEDVARHCRQHLDEIERMKEICPELNALIDKLATMSFNSFNPKSTDEKALGPLLLYMALSEARSNYFFWLPHMKRQRLHSK